jgi:hypothetical protein
MAKVVCVVIYIEKSLGCYAAFTLVNKPVAGVLDEPYSQLCPLSGVAGQDRQST